ncbi:putative disease resistance RPP13-like protein 3 [Corylus avellana]|uniref:putative disease resistance RPP13-like protein 3 n=1 Tax=Corylus avellana TaxID=13451 RepID=UPI00286D3693|nr:putative disease resistance RPP13-like protein 3 [Corylus avellana]
MADFVVNFLLEHLSQLLVKEANSFGGVEDQVKSLHRELTLINIFLETPEGKRSCTHEMVEYNSKGKQVIMKLSRSEMLRKIVDVAYEAEDVIDTIILNVATQTDKPDNINHATHVGLLHDVAKRIEELKKEINKIYNNIMEKDSFESDEASIDAATNALLNKRWREDEEDGVVGFNFLLPNLVKLLTEGNPQLDVVSIFGEGGSGKTTLARKIYNNVDIKSHFNFRAFVCISKNFRTREVLVEILKSEMPKSDELTRKKLFKYLSVDELKNKLFKCLQGKRYLVVLDGIWRTQFWYEVRSAFPDNSNGSRILITSHIEKMASHAGLTPPYHLPALNKDESWELFNKRVFPGGSCPTNLETLGRQILESCKGLPLSIVVLAGILAYKENKYETWANFNGHVYGNPNKQIRELCYFQLPRNLKPCLLYLCVFPKGFEIPVRLLIKLWVAEGFIQHPRNPEDVAEDYLEKLIDRGWVQVASKRTDGGAKTCRIHDLVQELCIRWSAVDTFLQVLFDSASTVMTPFTSRRVSLQVPIEPYVMHQYTPVTTRVRSLFFFNQDTYGLGPKQWKWVHENFKLGRVLNLGQEHLYSIPTVITKLIHLRYLGIESDALKAIPSSIGKLINLETLNMKGTFLNCLPTEIWKLRCLRNLYVSGPVSLPNDLDRDAEALCLQVLSTVSPKPQSSLRMTNVRNLGLWFASDESNSESLWAPNKSLFVLFLNTFNENSRVRVF